MSTEEDERPKGVNAMIPINCSIRSLGFSGNFGAILVPSDIPMMGKSVTFTFQKGGYFSFDFTSDTTILQGLRERMANYGNVMSVSRPLFSNRWVVTVIPTVSVNVNQWWDAFDSSWKDMGYSDISFIQAEGGAISTLPGGLQQFVPEVTKPIGIAIGGGVGEIVKPLLPYILLFGIGYVLLFTGFPKLLVAKASTKKGR